MQLSQLITHLLAGRGIAAPWHRPEILALRDDGEGPFIDAWDEDQLGAVPALTELQALAPAVARAGRRQQIQAIRDHVVHGGINWTHPGTGAVHVVQTAETSLVRLTGTLAALGQGMVSAVDWRMTDNSVVTLTAAQFAAMAGAVFAHVQAAYSRQAALEAELAALATAESIEAHPIDAGWPADAGLAGQ